MFYITLALFARDNNCSVSALACSSFVAWIALLVLRSLRSATASLQVAPYFPGSCVCLSLNLCLYTLLHLLNIHKDTSAVCVSAQVAYSHHISVCVRVCVLIRGGKWEVTGSAQQWAGFKNIANCQEIFCAQLSTRTHTKWHIAWSSSAKLVGWVFSCNSKQD